MSNVVTINYLRRIGWYITNYTERHHLPQNWCLLQPTLPIGYSGLVYCRYCSKRHTVTPDDRPCAFEAWIPAGDYTKWHTP